ncbi:MAG: MFS transporter [Sedimentisphaerales bacterium]
MQLKLAVVATVYFTAVINDNFYRQVALLLVVAGGMAHLQGYATCLFMLPFILFAAHAGFLADRFSKRSVIIAAKALALLAFVFGAVGLYWLNWPIIMAALFILGLQAALFSPAINGTIPELCPSDYVVTANGIIQMVATVAILLGIAGAGFVLDIKGVVSDIPFGRFFAVLFVIAASLVTLLTCFAMPRFPAASPRVSFPWRGPWESVVTLFNTRRDPLLAVSICSKAFFWFAGSLQILIVNPLGLTQFGLTKTLTSVLIVVELVGIAVGSLLAPFFARGVRWYRVLVPASFVMAASMFAVAIVPFVSVFARATVLVGALAVLGLAGGVFSVPLTSFVQTRPATDLKGRMIASSNLADFLGILLSGVVFCLLDYIRISPSNCFAIEGVIVTAGAGWLLFVLARGKMQ